MAQEELQRQSTLGEDEGLGLEAAQYCMKDETHPPGSYRWRWGTLKECQKRRSREELEETVIEEVDDLKKKFKPAAEINSQVLARPGFLAAYNALTADMLGVYRPNLKIVTMVGPPEQAKASQSTHSSPRQAGQSSGTAALGSRIQRRQSWCSRSSQGRFHCRRCSSYSIHTLWHSKSRAA